MNRFVQPSRRITQTIVGNGIKKSPTRNQAALAAAYDEEWTQIVSLAI